VKRGKTDAADAEAIAEAVTRPTMRFVAVKSMDQQAVLMLHKVRDLLVRQHHADQRIAGPLGRVRRRDRPRAVGVKAAIAELHECGGLAQRRSRWQQIPTTLESVIALPPQGSTKLLRECHPSRATVRIFVRTLTEHRRVEANTDLERRVVIAA
jgi:transposase